MKIRRSQLKDTVSVQTRSGEGAYGPVNAAARTVRCSVEENRRMVRDSSGDETVSESTLLCHPSTQVLGPVVIDEVTYPDACIALVDPVDVFTPESPVTIGGRASRVLAVKQHKVRSSVVVVEVTCA